MAAHGVTPIEQVGDDEILDVDTSAAILRWMESDLVPDGVGVDAWELWVEAGCKGALVANALPITSVMLGRWARSGSLR
jgi:hypothetical protein